LSLRAINLDADDRGRRIGRARNIPPWFLPTSVVSVTAGGGRLCYVGTRKTIRKNAARADIALVGGQGQEFCYLTPGALDERTHPLQRHNGMLYVLQQAAADRERRITAMARRKRPILL